MPDSAMTWLALSPARGFAITVTSYRSGSRT